MILQINTQAGQNESISDKIEHTIARLDKAIEEERKFQRTLSRIEQILTTSWNRNVWKKRKEAAQGLIPTSEIPAPIIISSSLNDGEVCKIVSMNGGVIRKRKNVRPRRSSIQNSGLLKY